MTIFITWSGKDEDNNPFKSSISFSAVRFKWVQSKYNEDRILRIMVVNDKTQEVIWDTDKDWF